MPQATVAPIAVARVVQAAAVEAPGVVALHGGAVGELATYGDGARVPGVAVRTGARPSIAVHVVATFGAALDALADDVRRRVTESLAAGAPAAAAWPVDVHVADVRLGTTDAPELPRRT